MALRFDLSAACAPCEVEPPSADSSAQQLTINFGLSQLSNTSGLVRRFASPVLQTFGLEAKPEKKCERGDDVEHDQFTVAPGRSLTWAVLFRHDTGRLHPRSLLGNYGHIERLPAWTHLIGGLAFLAYAVLRPILITEEHTVAETLTTAAASSTSLAFLSSTVYHVTSPSKSMSFWTRQLDYAGIYQALAVGYVADMAIATRSFQRTTILSIVDGPIACLLLALFFLSRRAVTRSDETWKTFLGGCTLNFGLTTKGHVDLEHSGTRQATSFLVAIGYFVTVPSLYANFGSRNATVIFMLEVGCLVVLIVGMALDNSLAQPDIALSKGRGPRFLVCKPCGCIGSAHALWHLLSVAAAVKSACSREYALSLS